MTATILPAAGEAAGGQSPIARQAALPAMVRVLHVVNGEHYAGAERVQDLLALRLPAEGFEVGFACVKPDRFPLLRQSRQSPLYALPMRGRVDPAPARRLARIIRNERFRLVHTHTPRAAFVGRLAAALAGVPVVHHLHSPTSSDTTHRLRNLLNAATERLSLVGVAGAIAVSRSLEQYGLRLGIPRDRLAVVCNGVPSRGKLPPRTTPVGEWTLGAVALFRPRKGLEVLLAALAQLRTAGLAVRLRAVGSFETPHYEKQIKQLAQQLGVSGAIDWRGFRSEVNHELDRMDLFVLPSLFGEGLPMVMLEAMAAGVPVIATRVEGVPEAIRDGFDGLIVAPGDARGLAASIGRVIAGDVDWQAFRANGFERQAEHFSDRGMAAGVAQVYRRVLRGTDFERNPNAH
ncbi:MAG TPA: glycosyltransferase [Pirellulales bacterium]|nr:glycosyltransferase [Pirellulales bacterium]